MATKKPWLLGCRWCGEVAERLIALGASTRWASSFWGGSRRFESFPLRLTAWQPRTSGGPDLFGKGAGCLYSSNLRERPSEKSRWRSDKALWIHRNSHRGPVFVRLTVNNGCLSNVLRLFQTVSEGVFSETGLPVYGVLGNRVAASRNSRKHVSRSVMPYAVGPGL